MTGGTPGRSSASCTSARPCRTWWTSRCTSSASPTATASATYGPVPVVPQALRPTVRRRHRTPTRTTRPGPRSAARRPRLEGRAQRHLHLPAAGDGDRRVRRRHHRRGEAGLHPPVRQRRTPAPANDGRRAVELGPGRDQRHPVPASFNTVIGTPTPCPQGCRGRWRTGAAAGSSRPTTTRRVRSSSRPAAAATPGDYSNPTNDNNIIATTNGQVGLVDVRELPGPAAAGGLPAQLRHRPDRDPPRFGGRDAAERDPAARSGGVAVGSIGLPGVRRRPPGRGQRQGRSATNDQLRRWMEDRP